VINKLIPVEQSGFTENYGNKRKTSYGTYNIFYITQLPELVKNQRGIHKHFSCIQYCVET